MWRGKALGWVLPLPKSWQRAAKRTSKGMFMRAHWSSTISKCTPVSTSGWCSTGCGTPYKRATSGNKICKAPQSRNTCNMREGWWPIKPLANSCHTRSATNALTSPSCTISTIKAWVSGATTKWGKRAANLAKRKMRTGSSRKAKLTWRSTPSFKSRSPP